jgi:hypothetical protein
MAVEVGTAYVSVLPDTKGLAKGITQTVGSAGAVAGKLFGVNMGKATNLSLAGVGLAIAAFASKAGMDMAKARRIITQETGASGKQLAVMSKDFEAVFAKVPENVDVVARTLDLV